MIVLGIETSCDETAAALVNDKGEILSNIIFSQIEEHQEFQGVVPEIAARSHLKHLENIIKKSLIETQISLDQVDAIAATCGPGLIGGLIVGAMMAKGMALVLDKPFIAVNHLEGHALTVRLTDKIEFPYLLLLVSGGHCQIILVRDLGNYILLGTTLDDAVGESFDKVAKLLNLPYPGGPSLEKAAQKGDEKKYRFPRPLMNQKGCDFSFSGLKTAVRNQVQKSSLLESQDVSDIAASFQKAVCDVLLDRLKNAMDLYPEITQIVIAGGVASNEKIRESLKNLVESKNNEVIAKKFIVAPKELCTDNAVMIAWVGVERLKKNLISSLDFEPRPRWPLSEL